ncbi:lysophospholipid acyltransferase family protein [Parvularcula maris]|uniref:1-acyl-sn-glycerol-3-phosphate acyltransferase n=1 Tax=Parvularcula maris TaxID=2965077 RepID=A0A9X2LA30_9PROT|nr:lysophospholipid acyltransferase family protein [Parvularcula maris]MCQ8185854.1 1-acyl-sn-glycerol-3-phosphate acyltransferase [Parvularcula maris]
MQKALSILFIVYLFVFSILVGIICSPALLKRDWSIAVSKFWAGGLLGGLNVLCGVKDEVRGAEHLPEGPALVAAKHQSMWETLKLMVILPRPSFVLKKELEHWPIFSWFCKGNGFIFIDRASGASAMRDMTAKSRARLAEGHQIVIFPEGTRSLPGKRVPYQPGVAMLAKTLKVVTVPISHNSGEHWVQPGPLKLPGTITMTVHPPISSIADRKAYLRAVEDAIEGPEEAA